MKGRKFYILAGGVGVAVIAALALAFGVFLWSSNEATGIDGRTVTESITSPALETASARATLPGGVSNAGGPSEGLQIHGHWVIEVRDPDGTLASRQEFDNAINQGHKSTAAILAREVNVGRWQVILGAPAAGFGSLDPCIRASTGNVRPCVIGEPGDTIADDQSLTVDSPLIGGSASNRVVLEGQVAVERDGQIGRVGTGLGLCLPPTSPCGFSDGFFRFSVANLATTETVVTGQLVQVTVTFTIN